MSGLNNIGPNSFWDDNHIREHQGSMNLRNIGTFYTSKIQDKDRTDFSSSFKLVGPNESEQGRKFWKGLISNKDSLVQELEITSEEYDNLACIAMALATQETGLGEEKGYVGENIGLHKAIRNTGKRLQKILKPAGSSSSGLTQIKIYDFMTQDGKLTPKQREILTNHGIEATSYTKNNLFAAPDKAAVATVVALKSLEDNYPNYLNRLQSKHEEVEKRINESEKDTRGPKIIQTIKEIYENSNSGKRDAIRLAFKHWLLAVDGSKISDPGVIDKPYNEEYQLNKLNSLLNLPEPIVQDDLDYIRYTLTADNEKMNMTQYCAYAWNNGTGKTSMQLDRLLATKVGVILARSDDFSSDQFTVNVEQLAKKYAKQMIG
ncbi:hypothetical protein IKQ26_06385 [bacterium]|nr:hypothetical protein [bacterium]